jgi:hypothetical protein
MRILASTRIVENADKVARMIVNNYLVPNKTFPELRDMVNSGAMDPLRDFSETCREEFHTLQYLWRCGSRQSQAAGHLTGRAQKAR